MSDEAVRKELAKELFEKLDEIARDQCSYDFGLSYSDVPLEKSLAAIVAFGQASRSAAIQECAEHIREHWGADTIVGKTSAESLLALKER